MYLSIRAAGSPDVTVHGPKVRGGSFFAMCLGLYFFLEIYTVEIRTVEARNSFDFWYMGQWVHLKYCGKSLLGGQTVGDRFSR